ncbi:cation:proton antiporter [Psychrilyobacter atlanticus]|uniref:cation:proton antiporter domain-containing protein n=1 Tax=Psychrilyobacter atlanticus TaxID=271091 RepID=UPI00041D0651|nr:cation:proton antiporter [Psychrilyobacter atlanticus]
MELILLLSVIVVMVLTGVVFTKLAGATKLPAIAGILIGGIVLGTIGRLLNIEWLTPDKLMSIPLYKIIYVLALSPLGFLLTKDVRLSIIKSNFKSSISIALIEIAITFSIVFGVMRAFGMPMSEAIILGIIGGGTSVATIIMAMQGLEEKIKARLLPTMFMNLVLVLLIFGIVKNLLTGSGGIAIPFIIMTTSLIYGIVSGFVLLFLVGKVSDKVAPLIYTIICTILLLAGTKLLTIDLLITLTVAGITFVNMMIKKMPQKFVVMEQGFQKIINVCILFFMVDLGMKLNVMLLANVSTLAISIAYTVSRITSRRIGYKAGSMLVKGTRKDVSMLGKLMLPQAGLALTFIAFAYKDGIVSEQTLSMVLAAMLITEILGLIIARNTVVKRITELAS